MRPQKKLKHNCISFTLAMPMLLQILLGIFGCQRDVFAQDGSEAKREEAKKAVNFKLGNLTESSSIPGTFGPFSSRSAGVGIYRGRLKVEPDDLKDNKFLVVRTQNDKDHKFGWIRCFVGNQLVANESSIKENRIVQDVTRFLKPTDSVVTVMGSAYPGTIMDFYVVPKDTVVKVLQGESLGNIVYSSGALKASGKNPEHWELYYDLPDKDERSPTRLVLTVKAVNPSSKPYSWIRVNLNGSPILSEQNFLAGEASLDVSHGLKKGRNKIDLQVASAPDSVFACFVSRLSSIASSKNAVASVKAVPTATSKISVTRMNISKPLKAGDLIEISGKGFQTAAGECRIYFDDKYCTPKKTSDSSLEVEIPGTLGSGQYNVFVCVGNDRCQAGSLTVMGVPKLQGSYPAGLKSGKELEIKGENFSENRDEVSVQLAGQALRILSSSKQHIVVLLPELSPQTSELSLKVSVAGIPASNELKLRVEN